MPTMRLKPKYVGILVVLSLALLILTGLAIYKETVTSRPWKDYQTRFNALDQAKTEAERRRLADGPDSPEKKEALALLEARRDDLECRPLAIRQLWLTDLGLTDRCASCHLGAESPRFSDAPQPFATHPGNHLAADRHPVERFGCVSCHDGQGVALTTEAAHAETDIWLKPILRGELAEASCRRCHAYDDTVPKRLDFPEAPRLSGGRRLYLDKGCLGCHVLTGHDKPGRIAPRLDRVAEKAGEAWIGQWMAKPRDYLPQTIMPFFDLSEEQIGQLGAYLTTLPGPRTLSARLGGDIPAGKALVAEIGCLSCHAVGDKGGTFGPDLNRVGEKIKSEAWLANWLDGPSAYDPETEMPDFRLTEDQIQDIGAYLLTLRKKALLAPSAFDKTGAAAGKDLFGSLGCTGCHKIEGVVYGFPRSPEHTGYADKDMEMFDFGQVKDIPRTKAAWTKKKLEKPKAFSTETIQLVMPDFELAPEAIRDLRVWLLSLTAKEAPKSYRKPLFDVGDPFLKGMRVVERFNCLGCHKMGLAPVEIDLGGEIPEGYQWAAATYALEDVAIDGRVVAVKGGEIGEDRVAELLARDPAIEDSLFRRLWFVDDDTAGYLLDMGLKRIKLLGLDEGDIMGNYKDLNFAPPILHYEGQKAQPNWLRAFLDDPYPVRPLTKATMPTFNLSETDLDLLADFFVAKDKGPRFFAVNELSGAQADKAEQVFKLCLQCHYFDQKRLTDKPGFGDLKGPNLAEVKRRLRPEYIRQWVKFPDLVIPGTQMKNFFYDFTVDSRFREVRKDETGVTDIGQPEKIEMMAKFLMNPFSNARLTVQR